MPKLKTTETNYKEMHYEGTNELGGHTRRRSIYPFRRIGSGGRNEICPTERFMRECQKKLLTGCNFPGDLSLAVTATVSEQPMRTAPLDTWPGLDWKRPPVEETGGTINGRLFDDAYLERLRSGDDETARHFDIYFRRVIGAKVWGTFNRQREADLIDDVMAAAIQSIMLGKPGSASCLSPYIYGICSNLTRVAMRPKVDTEVVHVDFEHMPDGSKTAVERLQETEIERAVGNVLSSLSRRDREVLVDLFFNGLSRAETSRKHGVTRAQLRTILFHALKRFRKKWERH
jgi:RNA polymerase sigma-70 factor, ECF subfamily